MTLKEKFENIIFNYIGSEWDRRDVSINLETDVDDFAIGFAEWKDDNFYRYKNKTYYANTSSQYFDITKYVGKEKPTKYYTAKELLEIFKQTL